MTNASKQDAGALHLTDGENHVVGFQALKVLLTQDEGYWVAQGLDLDYASYGSSVDEAKTNFANGLEATVRQHLKQNGDIEHLLKVAPQSCWAEYYEAAKLPKGTFSKQRFTTVQFHFIKPDDELDALPFKQIEFLSRTPEAGVELATA